MCSVGFYVKNFLIEIVNVSYNLSNRLDTTLDLNNVMCESVQISRAKEYVNFKLNIVTTSL